MSSFAVTDIIRASRSRIWSVWLDIDRWPEWTPTVTAVTPLGAGTLKPGSETRLNQPKLRPAIWRVTELDESVGLFTWVSRSPGVTTTGTHRAEPTANGTRVTLAVEFSGLLAPLVSLLFGSLTRQYIASELAGLKARCES
jgi:hypothetical protein